MIQENLREKIMENRAVLFVDDEDKILKAIERCLLDESYRKYFAKSGQEALEILRRQEVHVIVVDMVMPGMDGLELIRIVKKQYPNIIIMVLSGYAQPVDTMMAMYEVGINRFISKPWTYDDDFRAIIRRSINNYDLQYEHEGIPAGLGNYSG
jgi:two-component system response regulator HupR/HoxA